MGFASFYMPFLGFLVASFFIQGLEAVSCPPNWFLYEKHCYGFYKTNLNWQDAETECASFGKYAHLASVLSERELDMISSSIRTNHEGSFRIWIGLYKVRGGTTRLRWLDAAVVDYLPFKHIRSDNNVKTRNCFELFGVDYKTLNDKMCCVKQPYLCKMAMH